MVSFFFSLTMPHSDLHLRGAFHDAFRQLDRGGKRFQLNLTAIEVRFYPMLDCTIPFACGPVEFTFDSQIFFRRLRLK